MNFLNVLEVGMIVKLRNGTLCEVTDLAFGFDFPIAARDKENVLVSLTKEGRYNHRLEGESDKDIVEIMGDNYKKDFINVTKEKETGLKFDDGKPRWDLLDLGSLSGVVDVLTHGAIKYGPNNWKEVDEGLARYRAAFMRHFIELETNNKIDKDSGLGHIDHCLTNLLFIRHFMMEQEKNK